MNFKDCKLTIKGTPVKAYLSYEHEYDFLTGEVKWDNGFHVYIGQYGEYHSGDHHRWEMSMFFAKDIIIKKMAEIQVVTCCNTGKHYEVLTGNQYSIDDTCDDRLTMYGKSIDGKYLEIDVDKEGIKWNPATAEAVQLVLGELRIRAELKKQQEALEKKNAEHEHQLRIELNKKNKDVVSCKNNRAGLVYYSKSSTYSAAHYLYWRQTGDVSIFNQG